MSMVNLLELEYTKGELMFYGGLLGLVSLTLLSIILVLVFAVKKKRLIKRIEKEY